MNEKKNTATPVRHPMQPVVVDERGTHRFLENSIVRYLLDEGPFDMNSLSRLHAMGTFSRDEYEQFTMLIGYSVSGFGELSSTTNGRYALAASMSEQLTEKVRRTPEQSVRDFMYDKEQDGDMEAAVWAAVVLGYLNGLQAEVAEIQGKLDTAREAVDNLQADLKA